MSNHLIQLGQHGGHWSVIRELNGLTRILGEFARELSRALEDEQSIISFKLG